MVMGICVCVQRLFRWLSGDVEAITKPMAESQLVVLSYSGLGFQSSSSFAWMDNPLANTSCCIHVFLGD